jgi:hypothetical protein
LEVNERAVDENLNRILMDLRNTGQHRQELEQNTLNLLESRICVSGKHGLCTKNQSPQTFKLVATNKQRRDENNRAIIAA